MFLQQFQGKLVVALRQRAVAHHVGEHDGGELALLSVGTHGFANIAPLQLGEKIVELHGYVFGASTFCTRASKRGSPCSGSSR